MKYLVIFIFFGTYVQANLLGEILKVAPPVCKNSAGAISTCMANSFNKLTNCSNQSPSLEQCQIVDTLWECMRNQTREGKLNSECAPEIGSFAQKATKMAQPNCTLNDGYNKCTPAIDITWEKIYVYVSGGCKDKKEVMTCYDVTKPIEQRVAVNECGNKTMTKTCGGTGAADHLHSFGLGVTFITILIAIIV